MAKLFLDMEDAGENERFHLIGHVTSNIRAIVVHEMVMGRERE